MSQKVAAGAVADVRYGAPLARPVAVTGGDWSDLAGAGVVLICAGVNEKSGDATDRDDGLGRLRLLEENAAVFQDVVPRLGLGDDTRVPRRRRRAARGVRRES